MAIIKVGSTYYESIDSESPTNYEFNENSSHSYITFIVKQDQIFQFIKDVLGYAELKNNSYVRRPIIPLSNPLFPWQYAYSIVEIKGVSANGVQQSAELQALTAYKDIQTEKPKYTGSYQLYKITVKFTSREYAVYTDDQLNPHTRFNQKYYMPYLTDVNPEWKEEEETYTDYFEFSRFCNWYYQPIVENLTYGGGNYWYRFPAGGIEDLNTKTTYLELPVSTINGGNQFFKLVSANIQYNWFQVPYQLCVQNQLWADCYGKINSETFALWDKGTLLLKEIKVKRYPPTYPFLNINLTTNSSVYDYYTEFYKNQYADVSFNFKYLNYSSDLRVPVNPVSYKPLQCKDINSFHNRTSYPNTGLWYYVESAPVLKIKNNQGQVIGVTANPSASPVFFSIPYQLLFNYKEGA